MNVLRLINITLILAAFCFITFWSAVFYIGSEESYAILKATLLISFAKRFIGFLVLSLLISLLIGLLNWIISKTGIVAMNNRHPFQVAWQTFAILSAGALIGSAVFFSN